MKQFDVIANWAAIAVAVIATLWGEISVWMYHPVVMGVVFILVLVVLAALLVHYLLEGDVFAANPDELQPEKPEPTEAETTVNNLLAMGRRVPADRVQGGGE